MAPTPELRISVEPAVPPAAAHRAQDVIAAYARRFAGLDELPFLAARYEFALRRVREGWRDRTYEFVIKPLGGDPVVDEWGKVRGHVFSTPSPHLNAVPDDPRFVYRGMAAEEWAFIRQYGYIESTGSHNLDQQGLTFFGDAPTAESYASNFAPLAYKPGRYRPGAVIAVDRRHALDHRDLPQKIPVGEFAIRGRLPASEIRGAWVLVPIRIDYGRIDLSDDGHRVTEGSRVSPSVRYVVVPW